MHATTASNSDQINKRRSTTKIVLIYTFVGIGWVLLSDRTAASHVTNLHHLELIANLKGVLFITITAGLLYSRVTKTFTGILTITNTTSATIAGPLLVTLNNLTPGVTLNNAGGSYNGYPQVAVPFTVLNAGKSVTVPVSFTNPANALIKFTPVTFQAQ